MRLEIKHQDSYSRGQLLLRSFLGLFYIIIPHMFILYFIALAAAILSFLSFWVVLFTGKYPKTFFNFRIQFYEWYLRVIARILNLSDGYPEFGMSVKDELVEFEVPYPEKLSRGILILRILFGFIYVIIPHFFILIFRIIASYVLIFVCWWIVLITGKYPESLFNFNVGTIRWLMRVSIYMSFMTDKYPPFSGASLDEKVE